MSSEEKKTPHTVTTTCISHTTIETVTAKPFTVTRPWLKAFVKAHFLLEAKRMQYNLPELHGILESARKSFEAMQTLIDVESPLFVCGDIHGQLTDLKRIFHICGFPKNKRVLFLGDYVDRGHHSLEVISLLLALHLLYPRNVLLLRGNHELQHINFAYGFRKDIEKRWKDDAQGADKLYKHYNEIFAVLPLAALVSKKILCMHGGLSPRLNSLDDIRSLKRPIKTVKGLAQDILWADPQAGVCGFKPNNVRACSYNFGEFDVKEKLKTLGVEMVIRAHQVVERGYSLFANRTLITVFSASRYQEDLWNYAGIVQIHKNLQVNIIQMKPREFESRNNEKKEEVTADFEDGNAEKGKTCEDE